MELKPTYGFNEIYKAYYRKSYLYVKSYVHDDMVAEDIVSDSLIKLWAQQKKEVAGAIDHIGPYLFSILKNRALDYLKHQAIRRDVHNKITKTLERELEIRTTSLESSDPGDIFSKEIQYIVEKTLQSLPQKTREIFVLSRFENIPHKKIAGAYNISVKGVDYHIAQAAKELRAALSDYLPFVGTLFFLNF